MNSHALLISIPGLSALLALSALPAAAQDRTADERASAERALAFEQQPLPSQDGSPVEVMNTISGTPILEVENAGAVQQLWLNDDGGFVVGGVFGTGDIPATGAGARLMWYPAKGAFRAGYVGDGQWDSGSVGDYSAAMGRNTAARGAASLAVGFGTEANGFASTAMGYEAVAEGLHSLALGRATFATGEVSTAMGVVTHASGQYSTALGAGTLASTPASTAMGFFTTSSGTHSTAMGSRTTASHPYSTAMGVLSVASQEAATAMGSETTASGVASTAMGRHTTARSYASVAIGRFNMLDGGDPFSWVTTDPLFVAGNGTSATLRSNALILLKNGNMTIAGTLTSSSDERLKEDITALEDGLATVLALRPVRYRFREGTGRPGGHQIGLVAQDVRTVLPELVREDADGFLSVSYANLTPVLAAAVQEQQVQIEALHRENEALRQRLEKLEVDQAARAARLASIEAALAAINRPAVTLTVAGE